VDHFVRQADLILGIGCSFSREWMAVPIPPGKTVIQITNDDLDIDADMPIDVAVLGDAKLVLGQLIEEVRRQAGPDVHPQPSAVEEIAAIKKEWYEQWMPHLTSDEIPISPYRVIRDLQRVLDPEDSIVTHDSGYVRDEMVPFYEPSVPRGYLGWGNSTQMGHSMGLALGAKVAAPEKTVVNVTGDGSFGMLGLEVETAARNNIGILTIILNNSVMCAFENDLPVAVERYRLKHLSGDYAKVAEGLGAVSERVERPEGIIPAIERAVEVTKMGCPALIEMITKEERKVPRFW
jgi:thiamine pyrophosphate-dependent acetolactate synthase large subunit-like protein